MPISTPHDRFFRESFGRISIARSYLNNYLPAPLRNLLDLSDLRLEDGSFLDETMQHQQSDLLFRAKLREGKSVHLYLLFEHKSYPDPRVGFQLLRYIVRIWERQEKAGHPLSLILPIVIYHGESIWVGDKEFATQVTDHELLKSFVPNFRYLLSDFSSRSDEEIRGEIWLTVTLSVLRAINDPLLINKLDALIELVFQLAKQQTGVEYIRTILYYMSHATDRVDFAALQRVIEQQGSQGSEIMKTIAQQLTQQGLEQGLEQGREQGKQSMILTVLESRFGISRSAYEERLAKIQAPELLERLGVQAAVATSLDAFDDTLDEIVSRTK